MQVLSHSNRTLLERLNHAAKPKKYNECVCTQPEQMIELKHERTLYKGNGDLLLNLTIRHAIKFCLK